MLLLCGCNYAVVQSQLISQGFCVLTAPRTELIKDSVFILSRLSNISTLKANCVSFCWTYSHCTSKYVITANLTFTVWCLYRLTIIKDRISWWTSGFCNHEVKADVHFLIFRSEWGFGTLEKFCSDICAFSVSYKHING